MEKVVCYRCMRAVPISRFGVARSRPTGRSPYCLPCHAALSRAYRLARGSQWNRARYRANPAMFKAHVYLNRAVKAGKIAKPDLCPICLTPGRKVEAHHHLGYAREHWLTVVWRCRSCHTLEHKRHPPP